MFKAHVFICTNSPDRPGKCGNLNSEKLRIQVKEECKKKYGKDVRVSSSGCMGQCEKGIAAVIYPANHWLLTLNESDTSKVLDAIDQTLTQL